MRHLTGLSSASIASPSIVTVPESGLTRPQIIATVVDLPAPFGPSSPTTSPRSADSDTSTTACVAP